MHIPLPALSDSLAPITEALDAATPDQRWNWLNGLSAKQQRALYDLAGTAKLPLRVGQMVAEDEAVVIHQGKNSLPAFTVFQKRFARLGDDIVGYNHTWFQGVIGAYGHYRAYDAPDSEVEVHIDYIDVPTTKHPEFPLLKDNTSLPSNLIYGDMVDILRRVSRHVTIGAALKGGKMTPNRFALLAPEAFGVDHSE